MHLVVLSLSLSNDCGMCARILKKIYLKNYLLKTIGYVIRRRVFKDEFEDEKR